MTMIPNRIENDGDLIILKGIMRQKIGKIKQSRNSGKISKKRRKNEHPRLKKAQSKSKRVYITYGNFEQINGKVANIGNVFVHIETEDNDEPVMLEIEKIIDISLLRQSC
jgi:hypothetical protein